MAYRYLRESLQYREHMVWHGRETPVHYTVAHGGLAAALGESAGARAWTGFRGVSHAPAASAAAAFSGAATPAGTHLTIVANYDSSITALQTSNLTLYTAYTGAITTAINYYENLITNPITVTIDFGWGEVAGNTVTAAGQSNFSLYGESYAGVAAALKATDTTSTVQTTAVGTLPATDPTGGATFYVASAEAKALGLVANGTSLDGSVGINSSLSWAFTQGSIPATSYDAIGVLEHEISEVMGREAFGGSTTSFPGTTAYAPLDLFRYTAAGDASNAALGSAAGARGEPFQSGYSAANQTYFSYNGTTVGLPFSSGAEVTAGNDIADWTSSIKGDSYGTAYNGTVGAISTTDQQVLNVLGYDLSTACYRVGTLIRTARGEVPIETLAIGDRVTTLSGASPRIRWIGKRRYAGPAAAGNKNVLPVRICAGALGHGGAGEAVPQRDLWVSPDHALYVDGLLIPARDLANGVSIVQETAVAEVSYLHLEFDSHQVIFAEGAAAESFVDDSSRARFDNAAEYAALYPDAEPAPARYCAPRVEEGFELEAVRRRLMQLAVALGHAARRAA